MTDRDSSFQSLRVILDARLPRCAMVTVSSACEGDGQVELACGLAQAFQNAGRRTALVSLCGVPGNPREGFDGPFFQLPLALNHLNDLVAGVRAEHEIVIAASPPVLSQSASFNLCRLADGVLLAVRLGRKVTSDDENTVTQLEHVAATLLGIVAMRSVKEKANTSPDGIVSAAPSLEAVAQ